MGRVLWIASLLILLSGCATAITTGHGQGGQDASGRSYSEARSDNEISAQIKVRLVEESGIQASRIVVTTRDGEVTLYGEVATAAQARQVEGIAASVPGVRGVVNRLSVR